MQTPHSGATALQVIVVGAGFMGSLHARAVRGSRQACLAAVVDRNELVAHAVGAELGVPAFTDMLAAIDETQPDAAIIATPDAAHREATETAIRAELAVLVEKPLATTVADAEAIVGLAIEHDVRLMVGHLLRFDSRYVQVAEAVRAGQMGRPFVASAARWGLKSLGARVCDVTTPLWHFLIHDIDAIQWATGGVIQDIAGAVQVDSPKGLSAFTATGTMSTGASFQLAGGWTLPEGSLSPHMTFEIHGELEHANIVGRDEGFMIASDDRAYRPDASVWPTVYGQIDGMLRREIEHFIGALIGRTPFVITPTEALDAVRSAVALEEAAALRRIG